MVPPPFFPHFSIFCTICALSNYVVTTLLRGCWRRQYHRRGWNHEGIGQPFLFVHASSISWFSGAHDACAVLRLHVRVLTIYCKDRAHLDIDLEIRTLMREQDNVPKWNLASSPFLWHRSTAASFYKVNVWCTGCKICSLLNPWVYTRHVETHIHFS